MANITYEHLHHAVKKGESWRKRLEAYKEKLENATTKVVRTLEVGAAAAIGGIIQGKAGPDGAHFMHVPVDLGAGLVLSVLGYMDAAGSYSDHLNNFGDGFVAAYTSNLGFHMGTSWKNTGKLFGGVKAAAGLPPPPPMVQGEISPEQMASIIANVRAAAGAPR